MLVNVSFDPKSRVKVQKRHRIMLQENPGITQWDKDFRKVAKWHRKRFSFAGFFTPYKPAPWEYTKNDPDEVFTGVYIVPDFQQTEDMVNLLTRQHSPKRYSDEAYKSGDIWYSYGLCDNASQVIKYYGKLKEAGRFPGNHIIVLEPMGKGGWRWHKWGTYIGDFDHCHEYFCDEEGIENVYCFNIIRVM